MYIYMYFGCEFYMYFVINDNHITHNLEITGCTCSKSLDGTCTSAHSFLSLTHLSTTLLPSDPPLSARVCVHEVPDHEIEAGVSECVE